MRGGGSNPRKLAPQAWLPTQREDKETLSVDRSLPSSSPQRLARKRPTYISPSQQQNSGLKCFQSLLDTGCLPHGTDFLERVDIPSPTQKHLGTSLLLFFCSVAGCVMLLE